MKWIIIIICLLLLSCASYEIEWFTEVPEVEFPFKNLYDDRGKRLNVILLAAPFRSEEDEQKYLQYHRQGLFFCGISSYLDFPNPISNPYEDRFHVERNHSYPDMTQGWIHCFRKPGYTEPFRHLPHILLTEADLKDVDAIPVRPVEKEYDFLYCCLDDNDQCSPGWQSHNRNWELAKRCLEVMCRDFHLRGILIGRKNCEFSDRCDGIVKVLPFLPHHQFLDELRKCRFLFVPNITDASPRVISDAITLDVPVLVNRDILGGWHNVIPSITGEFFTNEQDIVLAIKALQRGGYTPRQWYAQHRGKKHSGKQLAEFLIHTFPGLNNKKTSIATITI